MKNLTIAAVLAISTFAGVANAAADIPKSRAQVVAELQAAKQAGHILGGEASVYPFITHGSDKTRVQVLAELQEAEQTGRILGGEASVYPVIALGSDKSRAQVLGELKDYASSHSTFIEH